MFFKATQKEKKSKRGFKVTTGNKDVFVWCTSTGSGHVNRKQDKFGSAQDKFKGKRPQFPVDVRRLKTPLLKLPFTNWNLKLKLNGPKLQLSFEAFFRLKGQFLFCFLASSPSRSSSRSKSRPIWLEDETGKCTVVSLRKHYLSVSDSVRKQPTFCDATFAFPSKRLLRKKHRNSILITFHYPDLGSTSDLSYREGNLLSQSEALPRSFLRGHFAGKPVVASPNVGCFLRLTDTFKLRINSFHIICTPNNDSILGSFFHCFSGVLYCINLE